RGIQRLRLQALQNPSPVPPKPARDGALVPLRVGEVPRPRTRVLELPERLDEIAHLLGAFEADREASLSWLRAHALEIDNVLAAERLAPDLGRDFTLVFPANGLLEKTLDELARLRVTLQLTRRHPAGELMEELVELRMRLGR